jgi:hypothetical protein
MKINTENILESYDIKFSSLPKNDNADTIAISPLDFFVHMIQRKLNQLI